MLTATLALWVFALGGYGLYVARVMLGLSSDDRLSVLLLIAVFTIFPTLGMILKGFSTTVMLAIVGSAGLGQLLGTAGHPERIWNPQGPSGKVPVRTQLAVVASLIVCAAIFIPMWVAIMNGIKAQ